MTSRSERRRKWRDSWSEDFSVKPGKFNLDRKTRREIWREMTWSKFRDEK
jgi:hypothetical protein